MSSMKASMFAIALIFGLAGGPGAANARPGTAKRSVMGTASSAKRGRLLEKRGRRTAQRASHRAEVVGKGHYKKVQKLTFVDDFVDAGTDRPDGAVVTTRRRLRESSLLKVRGDFVPELIKSAEDV